MRLCGMASLKPNRDRGRTRNLTPPTPPCVRDRTRRFNEHIPVIPRGMANLLASGSAKTWPQDLHPGSYVPCPARTLELSGTQYARPLGRIGRRTLSHVLHAVYRRLVTVMWCVESD